MTLHDIDCMIGQAEGYPLFFSCSETIEERMLELFRLYKWYEGTRIFRGDLYPCYRGIPIISRNGVTEDYIRLVTHSDFDKV